MPLLVSLGVHAAQPPCEGHQARHAKPECHSCESSEILSCHPDCSLLMSSTTASHPMNRGDLAAVIGMVIERGTGRSSGMRDERATGTPSLRPASCGRSEERRVGKQ